MTNRYRWFVIDAKVKIKDIRQGVQENYYNDKDGFGFSLRSARNNYIEGAFLEKVLFSQELFLASGDADVVEAYRLVETKFLLKDHSDWGLILVLINPPQRKKKFLSALYNVVGYDCVVCQIKIDVASALGFLREKFSRVKIFKVSALGVSVTERSAATVDVVSVGDADKDLQNWLSDRRYHLARVSAKVSTDGVVNFLEVAESGTITCPESFYLDAEKIALACGL